MNLNVNRGQNIHEQLLAQFNAHVPMRFVGESEVADLLGLSRESAEQIVNTKDFPEAAEELAAGAVWFAEEVERWIEERLDADGPHKVDHRGLPLRNATSTEGSIRRGFGVGSQRTTSQALRGGGNRRPNRG